MGRIRNLNHQVTFENYARCVAEQLAFAVGITEEAATVRVAEDTTDVRACYDHGVSVNACAESIA